MTTPGDTPYDEQDTTDKAGNKAGAEIGMVEGEGSTFEPEEDTGESESE
jgi:hypothetical protein